MKLKKSTCFFDENLTIKYQVADFCNALLYGLADTDLPGLQMILNAAVRIITLACKKNPENTFSRFC